MRVTYNWLKDFVQIKLSPRVLAEKLTMAGLEVVGFEEQDGDFVFEIEVTSNRPDWLSVAGVAREISAITGEKLKQPQNISSSLRGARRATKQSQIEIASVPTAPRNDKLFTVTIENKKDCPLYTAKIIRGCQVGPSPQWLRKHLESVGCRSINNIVDITNYVLFGYGQPLHAFDLDKLYGQSIIVRRARAGEKIITIDEEEKFLDPSVLVIADGTKPVAVAGVMGGKDTEVTFVTKNILLEAAVFEPVLVRSCRRKLGLESESAYRFERGVNAEGVENASMRAAELIAELAAGRCVLAKSSGKAKKQAKTVKLDALRLHEILGSRIPALKIKKILSSLGFTVKNKFLVVAPAFRQDVHAEIDLVEEVARIYGYGNIANTLPAVKPQVRVAGLRDFSAAVKNILTGLGLNEVITYSLSAGKILQYFPAGSGRQAPAVLNPLSEEQEVLRTTLIPGLAACVSRNLNQKQNYVNIFEIAKVFAASGGRIKEELTLGIALCGVKTLLLSQGAVKDAEGLLHLKGILEALFKRLGITDYNFKAQAQGADIYAGSQKIGSLSALSSKALERLDVKHKDVFVLEISLEALYSLARSEKKFSALPKYPAVERDISFIIQESLSVQEILAALLEKGAPLLAEARIADYYKGKQIPAGWRGLTVSCFYRSPSRTLTEGEISSLHDALCALLAERFGAKIR